MGSFCSFFFIIVDKYEYLLKNYVNIIDKYKCHQKNYVIGVQNCMSK